MPALTPSTDQRNDCAVDCFGAEVARIREIVGDQLVVSQSHAVDWLLDLYNLTDEPAVRSHLGAFMGEIRLLRSVEGERVLAALDAALAAFHVEDAFAGMIVG